MAYHVKEMFYTLQGEGANTGRSAVFCRFVGCNLWSGYESHRKTSICNFCDTNFVGIDGVGGGKFNTSTILATTINSLWPKNCSVNKFVVFTGGEPLLQLDTALINSVHTFNFKIAVETNGTIPVISGIDWVCVSPKIGAELRVLQGNELKIIFPQDGLVLSDYEKLDFVHFFLQPMDCKNIIYNTKLAINIVKSNPHWRLSIQTHKLLHIS